MKQEQVLSVPTSVVDRIRPLEGVDFFPMTWFDILRHPQCGFRDRAPLEEDSSFKQIIPCIVIFQGDKLLLMRRVGGDKRLVGNYSIIAGGHVNTNDLKESSKLIHADTPLSSLGNMRAFTRGLRRELDEEILIVREMEKVATPLRIVGVVNMSDTDVAQKHFGFIFSLELGPKDRVELVCSNQKDGRMVPLSEMLEDKEIYGNMEGWSLAMIQKGDQFLRACRSGSNYMNL